MQMRALRRVSLFAVGYRTVGRRLVVETNCCCCRRRSSCPLLGALEVGERRRIMFERSHSDKSTRRAEQRLDPLESRARARALNCRAFVCLVGTTTTTPAVNRRRIDGWPIFSELAHFSSIQLSEGELSTTKTARKLVVGQPIADESHHVNAISTATIGQQQQRQQLETVNELEG